MSITDLIERWCVSTVYRNKSRAVASGIPFSISSTDVLSVFPVDMICPALKIRMVLGRYHPDNPSLDRLIPSKGYVVGNIAVICKLANRIKNDATLDELKLVAKWAKAVEDGR